MTTAPFTVVIPSRNMFNLTRCIEAIRAHRWSLYQILVVDDGLHIPPGHEFYTAETHTARRRVSKDICIWPGIKPFIFARNVNRGICGVMPDNDVLVLNDDAILGTPGGFEALSMAARSAASEFGVVSAIIEGAAAAPDQTTSHPRYGPVSAGLGNPRESEHHMLAFVCVYLTRRWIRTLLEDEATLLTSASVKHGARGPFDERFEGYGYDDDDLCRRIKNCGGKLGVFDGCLVEHGSLPSTFRQGCETINTGQPWRAAGASMLAHNRQLFDLKWGKQ